MALFLVLAWLPVVAHCQMESLPGLAFLECASHEAPSGDDCNEHGCCAVESSSYQVSRHEENSVSLALVLFEIEPVVMTVEVVLPAAINLGVLTAAPPELARSWQFVSRTALPVRAPSFAS